MHYSYCLILMTSFVSLHAMETNGSKNNGIIIAPSNMNMSEVFKALYFQARIYDIENESFSLNEEITAIAQQPDGYVDCYTRTKCSLVNFANFPTVNISRYDDKYGAGAAQQALDGYRLLAAHRKLSSPVLMKNDEEDEADENTENNRKIPTLSWALKK